MSNNDILLSVAVITYNQEKTISKTLDSILEQEHDYPYEIIIGDDCSVDGTKSVIENYVLRYPKIVKAIYNRENMGVVGNYFNVIDKCSGKYIMECAGDDWWLQGKIKTQIEFMESHNDVGMCYGKAMCYNSKNECMNIFKGVMCDNFYEVLEQNPVPAVTVCFKNNLMHQYICDVMPITRDWKMEDYPIWLWFYKNSKVSYLSTPLACYKYSNESVSNTKNIEKQISFLKSTYDIRNFYAAKYGGQIKKFEDDETAKFLIFCQLLNSYDREKAQKMRNVLLKEHTLKNIIKSLMISNIFFAHIGKIIVKYYG